MSDISTRILEDQVRLRHEVMVRRVLHVLRSTIDLRPISPEANADDVRAEFTDASARVVAPLCEAIQILEAIIWSSDGCVGHKYCAHSMEPWVRARALLGKKWEADQPCSEVIWPDPQMPKVTR